LARIREIKDWCILVSRHAGALLPDTLRGAARNTGPAVVGSHWAAAASRRAADL